MLSHPEPGTGPDRGRLDITIYTLYIKMMTAKQVMDILRKNGWILGRVSGSHHVFEKDGAVRPVSVPVHGNRDMGPIAKAILKQAGITK